MFQKISTSIFVNTFLFGCKFVNTVNNYYNEVYSQNHSVRLIAWYVKYCYYSFTSQYLEPEKSIWMSKSWLIKNNESYKFVEKYKTNFDDVFVCLFRTSISLYDMINTYFKMFCNNDVNDTAIFILKTLNEDNDECYFICKNDKPIPNISFKRSAAKFLTIEYIHPEMKSSIELTLEYSWFYVGNELFTPTFILRALKYQSQPFFFDMNYRISIMDNDINIVEFGSNKHIVLTEDGYKLIGAEPELESELDSDVSTEDSQDKTEGGFFEVCGYFLNDIS